MLATGECCSCSQLLLSLNSGRFDLCRAACAALCDVGASSTLPILVCLGTSQSCTARLAKGPRYMGLLVTFPCLCSIFVSGLTAAVLEVGFQSLDEIIWSTELFIVTSPLNAL